MPPDLRLGNYVVDGLLGPGGVTETYLVHGEGAASSELFALKLLRRDRVPTRAFSQVAVRFLAAGRQLREFHRPGFGKVLELSDDPAATFIVSELVSGCDLARLLEGCQAEGKPGLPPAWVGLVGSEIARLLHVAHAAKPPLGHLGLCPRNVVVAASGDVCLLDAGIAASLRALTEQAPERWALVAPELRGVDVGARPLDDRAVVAADLYSLGALLFLLLTGSAPKSPERGAVVEVPPVPELTGNLAAALRTLLGPEPADRPEHSGMLVEWLAGDAIKASDRRSLLGQGVRAIEMGPRPSAIDPPALLPAGSAAPSLAGPAVLTEVSSDVLPAASWARAFPRLGWRSGAVFLGLVAGAALAGVLGWDTRPSSPALAPGQSAVGLPVQTPEPVPTRGQGSQATPASPGLPATAADEALLARVAGHLIVETVPPGAMLWVDGVLAGTTFADVVVGAGSHRIAVIARGHRMLLEVVDTSAGAIIRRSLTPAAILPARDGAIDVACLTPDRYPVLLDEEETGLLCPAKALSTSPGKHTVAIFVPREHRTLSVEAIVEPGGHPTTVRFRQ